MTLLGKIFTLLIFIMSLVFMTFSVMVYATHRNWKIAALNPPPGEDGHNAAALNGKAGLKHQVEDKERTIEGLNAELQALISELERERVARRMAIQNLETKNLAVQDELDTERKQLEAKEAENSQLLEEAKTARDQLADLTKTVSDLEADIKEAREKRDSEFNRVVALNDKLHQNEGVRRRLEERRDQLALQITNLERVMRAHGLTVNTPTTNKPPALDGYVTQVSTKNASLLEISLGSDDGIRVGHELVVFRDKNYLGRIVIRKVDDNRAVAEVIKDTRRGSIRKNDNVTTRIS